MCCAMLHWGNIFVVLQHISKMLRKVLEGVINVNQKLSTEKANVFNPELEGNGAKWQTQVMLNTLLCFSLTQPRTEL